MLFCFDILGCDCNRSFVHPAPSSLSPCSLGNTVGLLWVWSYRREFSRLKWGFLRVIGYTFRCFVCGFVLVTRKFRSIVMVYRIFLACGLDGRDFCRRKGGLYHRLLFLIWYFSWMLLLLMLFCPLTIAFGLHWSGWRHRWDALFPRYLPELLNFSGSFPAPHLFSQAWRGLSRYCTDRAHIISYLCLRPLHR